MQVSGLSALHAANNLLQGPYYQDFTNVIHAIDEHERAASTAVASTTRTQGTDVLLGYISIQVMGMVLSQHGVQLLDAVMVAVREVPQAEQGFLCHANSHCFALRSLHGMWWSSLLKSSLLKSPRVAIALRKPRSLPQAAHKGQLFHGQKKVEPRLGTEAPAAHRA